MATPRRIIVADDDPDDQMIISGALTALKEHLEVIQVLNGSELLDALDNDARHPDLIILDLNMPVMDGVEALSTIKADKELRDIPVYILSTMRDMSKVVRSKEMGAEKCYSKPNSYLEYKILLQEIVSGME